MPPPPTARLAALRIKGGSDDADDGCVDGGTPSATRLRSSSYTGDAGIAGVLGLVAAGLLATVAGGNAPMRFAGAAFVVAVSLRLLYVALRGGAWIDPETVTSRGVLATSRLPRSRVTGVSVVTDHRGVSGVLRGVTDVPLRGVTYRHRHSPSGVSDCESCARNREAVAEVAAALSAPLS